MKQHEQLFHVVVEKEFAALGRRLWPLGVRSSFSLEMCVCSSLTQFLCCVWSATELLNELSKVIYWNTQLCQPAVEGEAISALPSWKLQQKSSKCGSTGSSLFLRWIFSVLETPKPFKVCSLPVSLVPWFLFTHKHVNVHTKSKHKKLGPNLQLASVSWCF